jgi:hypothetical protein
LSDLKFVRLHYLYCDYSNYKNHGSALFSNPNDLSLDKIESELRKHLLGDIWFIHSEWNLPDLHFEKTDWEQDHSYHEFVSLEIVNEISEVPVSTIKKFLKKIKSAG